MSQQATVKAFDKFSLTGIYGGTFDPIHYGHLRIAEELLDILGLTKILFVPSGAPRLRAEPAASRTQRAEMVKLAIQDNGKFLLDEREIKQPGISTTVRLLREYRSESESDAALCFILGVDAFAKIDQWVEWRELFKLCHLIVVARPGYMSVGEERNWPIEVKAEFAARCVTNAGDLELQSTGLIHEARTSLLDISATQIRSLIAAGKSARYLLPDSVCDYIKHNNLYKRNGF